MNKLGGIPLKRSQRGFTLVEMAVVIAILGVLAAVATPLLVNYLGGAKERAYEKDLGTVQTALDAAFSAPANARFLGKNQYAILGRGETDRTGHTVRTASFAHPDDGAPLTNTERDATAGVDNRDWNPLGGIQGANLLTSGHIYQVVTVPGGTSWQTANAAAAASTFQGLQGHLATITSAAENDLVLGLFSSPTFAVWIGGVQPSGSPEPAGGWQWVTGEPFVYTNWNTGEPNNAGGEDVLALLNTTTPPGRWNDVAKNLVINNVGYVIEYDVPAWTDDGDAVREIQAATVAGSVVTTSPDKWSTVQVTREATTYFVDARYYFVDMASLVTGGFLKETPKSSSLDNSAAGTGSYIYYVDDKGKVQTLPREFPTTNGFVSGVYP